MLQSLRDGTAGLAGDVLCLYFHPGTLFRRLPVVNRATQVLLALAAFQVLYAVAVLSTGVHDYELDRQTQHAVARGRLKLQGAGEEEKQLAGSLDALEKEAGFYKVLNRIGLVAGGPLRLWAAAGLLSGALFLVVALRGRQPDYRLLLGVSAFAACVEVPRLLLELLLVSQLHVSRVELSAAAFVSSPDVGLAEYVLLLRLDPFAVWFWALIGVGLYATGQLSRRAAVVTAVALALVAAAGQAAVDVLSLADLSSVIEQASGIERQM
jgi:hypothetical protein